MSETEDLEKVMRELHGLERELKEATEAVENMTRTIQLYRHRLTQIKDQSGRAIALIRQSRPQEALAKLDNIFVLAESRVTPPREGGEAP